VRVCFETHGTRCHFCAPTLEPRRPAKGSCVASARCSAWTHGCSQSAPWQMCWRSVSTARVATRRTPRRTCTRLHAERWLPGGGRRRADPLSSGLHRGRRPLMVSVPGLSQPPGERFTAYDVALLQQQSEATSHGGRRSRLGVLNAPRTPRGGAGWKVARRIGCGERRPSEVIRQAWGRVVRCGHVQPQNGQRAVGKRRGLQVSDYLPTVGPRLRGAAENQVPLVGEGRGGIGCARGGRSPRPRQGAAGCFRSCYGFYASTSKRALH